MPDSRSEPAKFDHYAGSYEQVVNRSISFTGLKVDYFTRVKAAYLTDLVERHFAAPAMVDLLDVGCGTGNLHPMIGGTVRSVTGVDISPESIARARAANPANSYLRYDGTRLPFLDGQFDAVTTVCVMHHVPPAQWPLFSSELRRVLKPGGLAMVFEHNPRNPLTLRAISNCPFDDDAVLLGSRKLCQLLADAGFTTTRARSILSIPSFGPATRGLDLALGRLRLGAQYFVTATP